MIRILFMIPTLGQGGAEKVLVNLVNNMDKRIFDITVMTLFDVGVNKQFLKKYIKYKYCFKKMFRANSQILKLFPPRYLYRRFVKEKYDIVVSYLEGPTARIISGCNNEKSKLISWIHVEQHDKNNASYAFRNYAEAQQCYERYDEIICVSETVKKDFQSIFNFSKSINVLYNVNETDDIIKKSQEEIDDLIIDNKFINICGVGSLKDSKKFDRLIKITERLICNGYKVRTYILGKGNDREKLEKYVKQHALDNNIFFLGYKINPYKYVSKMDLFVCSSIAEGFNTAATEALIVGTPVITTLVSGMQEMLGENDYGIITDNDENALYDGIKNLLDHPKKLLFYKQKARERGLYFSKENTVKEIEADLLHLINNNRHA